MAGFAVLIGVLSFGYAVHATRTDASAAYYSTFTRVWELLLGALLAACAAGLARLPGPRATRWADWAWPASWSRCWSIRPDVGFPAPSGALPVLAAGLVIASGVGVPRVGATRVLTLAPLQYFGLISYSLYLVHWPVLVIMRAVHPQTDWFFYTASLVLTVVLTLLLHHLVEMPVLGSRFLLPWRPGHGAPARRRPHPHNRMVLGGALALVLALVAVSQVAQSPDPASASYTTLDRATALVAQDGVDGLQVDLRRSLQAGSYPALTPPLGDASGEVPLLLPGAQCLSPTDLSDPDQCTFGSPDATKLAVVVGDSVSTSYLPGLVATLTAAGYRVHGMALGGCPSPTSTCAWTTTWRPSSAATPATCRSTPPCRPCTPTWW